MTKTNFQDSSFQIKNVRLSFPNLFQKATFNGKETKFAATFLIPKSDKKTIALINSKIDEALTNAKLPKNKVPSDKFCLRDGEDFEYDGYENHYCLKAGNNRRPTLVDRDGSHLSESDEDEKLYAGCYVNAIVNVWIQNNAYGKRVNCNLLGVQFFKDGDRFSSGNIDVSDKFDTFDAEDNVYYDAEDLY